MIARKVSRTPLPARDAIASPAEDSFRSLIRVFGIVERVMQPYFARFGISGTQWGVLRTLMRAEHAGQGTLRLVDLSRRLLVRPPSITGVVDRLERAGLVQRNNSSKDQRTKLVALTDRGRELVESVLNSGHGARQYERLMSVLSQDELRGLHALLDRLGSHLEGLLSDTERTIDLGGKP